MRSASHRLNQELRDLIEVVRTVDLRDEDASTIAQDLRDLSERLRPYVVDGTRAQSDLALDPSRLENGFLDRSDFGLDLTGCDLNEIFPYSPIVGELNPISPPCRLSFVDDEPYSGVEGELTLGAVYAGPPDSVHGGIVAAVLDEVLGGACGVNGLAGFTGKLSISYLSRVPLGRRLVVRGRVTGTERRKVFASGELLHGEIVCAEAAGIFIRPDLPSAPFRRREPRGSSPRPGHTIRHGDEG